MDFLNIVLDKLMDLQNVNLMTGSLTLSSILRKCQVCKALSFELKVTPCVSVGCHPKLAGTVI